MRKLLKTPAFYFAAIGAILIMLSIIIKEVRK